MKKRRKQEIRRLIVGLILVVVIFAYETYLEEPLQDMLYKLEEREILPARSKKVDGDLNIYYFDVGQADCILIQNKNHNMVIDAGNNADGKYIVKAMKSIGVEKIDYLVGTHAHEDHIGGMDDIINNFSIEKFYMPDAITTTKTFEDVLDALDAHQVKFETPKINDEFSLNDVTFCVLHVGTNKNDLNETSIVLRLTYKDTSYLFMGDAPTSVEKDILSENIKSDVLKVGHHGSQYSTSDTFLKKVNPKYAIIEVGKNNIYNHPKEVTLNKLKKSGVQVYRTDLDGTILLTSDGKNYNFEKIETNTNGG